VNIVAKYFAFCPSDDVDGLRRLGESVGDDEFDGANYPSGSFVVRMEDDWGVCFEVNFEP
jgi:hypothetical protein